MYKKVRFILRFLVGLTKKYFVALVFGLSLGFLFFLLAPRLLKYLPASPAITHIGLVGRYSLSDLPLSLQQKISIGLTTIGDNGLPSPALADSWEATDSGKTYTFTLNPNFTWHDGSKVISRDIDFNFSDITLEYPNDSHLVIRLKDSFSPLPSVVSRPIIKSVSFPKKYLGVGHYRITGFRRNGTYLESLTLSPPTTSSLPVLKYHFYPTQSQARTAFKLGILQSVEDLTDYRDLASWPNLSVNSEVHSNRYVAVFFNTQDPAFQGQSGKNLRFALAYAIDKSTWSDTRRAYGPINEGSWAYNPDLKKYDYDPARAKSLLKNVEKIPDTIFLTVVPAYLETAETVKKDWETLGLKVELQVQPDVSAGSFQALIVAQATPIDPDQYNLWHSTQTSTNLTRLSNPRIDKLLEDGRKTSELAVRKQIYQDFQRFLLEESPAVFLFHPESFTVTRK